MTVIMEKGITTSEIIALIEQDYYPTGKDGSNLFNILADEKCNIVIPDGCKRIGAAAFKGMPIEGMQLPDSLEYIGESAFENCGELEEIIIPDSVKSIGKEAFRSCFCLKTLYIPAGTRNHFMKILSKGKHKLLVELEK